MLSSNGSQKLKEMFRLPLFKSITIWKIKDEKIVYGSEEEIDFQTGKGDWSTLKSAYEEVTSRNC